MNELKPCLEQAINFNTPVMIWSAPGIGKSSLVKQIAKEKGIPLIDFRATLREPVDLRGLPMVDSKTATSRWLPPAELPIEKRDGKRGILFLDELPQATQAMQAACFSLVLDRHIGEYALPPGWAVIAAGNRMGDRSGASRMLKALANRFSHYEVEVDVESWMKWAYEADINPLVAAFIRFRPKLLHDMPDGEANAFPTPRAWETVAKFAGIPDDTLRRNMVTAAVGEAAAVEFEGFVRVWSKLPSIDLIFTNPEKAHVPSLDEPAQVYAVASAMARRVKKPQMENAFRYVARLPKEIQVSFALDCIARDASLKETRAFGNWYAANGEVLT
jgi:hypothetical protein